MELIIADFKKLKKELLGFYRSQYHDNELRRDSLSGLLEGILFEKSVMCHSVETIPLMVKSEGSVIMCCVLARASRMKEYLQISFFESSRYSTEAFELIYAQALYSAQKWGTQKICASLNIHVNYGLGFLSDSYDRPQSFGMAHNYEFIHRYFREHGFEEIPMVTFFKDMKNEFSLIDESMRKRLAGRYTVRTADLRNIEREALIYTRLNNDAFRDHLFYYMRDEKEDLELFRDLRFLIRNENLLFVQKDGVEVGFMLWYPDFHELMDQRETVGVRTVIKTAMKRNSLRKFKIVEMGVIKEEQKKGAILALFDCCLSLTKGRYDSFESGWVLKENYLSGNFGYKWADGVSKTYSAYVKEL